ASSTLMDATTEWELIQAVNDGMNQGLSANQIIQYAIGRVNEAIKQEKDQYTGILTKAGKL
ncbi:MAG: hypothetical protein FWH35_07220, partial [Treponema sp.]|nr:hypothetical protein [Treponema sp.]